MTTWIMMGVAVYLAGLFLPSTLLMTRIGLAGYVGSRDEEPEPGLIHGRALRANRNMAESFILFLAFGALSFVVPEADTAMGVLGAQIFVLARIAYLPLYLLAVPWLRSGIWTVGFVGLGIMAISLV